MPMSARAFADESGHSGKNHRDTEQPVFVIAGWVIPTTAEEDAKGLLRPVIRNNADLKFFRYLHNRPQQRERVARMVLDMFELGCVPFVNATEKEDAIWMRLVVTFLDARFNPNGLPPEVPALPETSRKLASLLPASVGRRFSRAFEECDQAGLEASRREVQRYAERLGDDWLAAIVRAFDHCDLPATLQYYRANPHERTPNYPAFLQALSQADKAFESIDASGPFIFDEQVEFSGPFSDAAVQWAGGGEPVERLLFNGAIARYGSAWIERFTMAGAGAEPLLLHADALAALCRDAVQDPRILVAQTATWRAVRRVFGVPEDVKRPRYGRMAATSMSPDRAAYLRHCLRDGA